MAEEECFGAQKALGSPVCSRCCNKRSPLSMSPLYSCADQKMSDKELKLSCGQG